MKYFDTHCHLNIEPLKGNIKNIIGECKDFIINNVGTDIENC
jgi:Tat protein secretion system quality control protein TatD with DNase activity